MTELWREVSSFIVSSADEEEAFNLLARQLFAYQFDRNEPYRRFCDAKGVSPESVRFWRDIPAAPASAFKRFALSCAPEDECIVFHSSGTTGAETSRHFMDADALDLYRLSLKTGFRRAISGDPVGIVAVMPSPDEAPHSSLSFMLEELGARFLTPETLVAWLKAQRKPCIVFGTVFALMNFFDATEDECFPLPEGSLVVETGGFKGRSREVSREELYRLFWERLGVPDERCYSEYGMSELASQFYSAGVSGRKVGPPWVRTQAIDPVTGTEALPGQLGLLCHYDLANYNSVLAVQTEDLGILAPDGSFELLGRASGAVLRGCSLASE